MMAEKYNNTYRIPTARAEWHTYDGGCYFVTICTKDRHHYLGQITDGEMQLSPIGEHLKHEIDTTATIRKDMNVDIPLYVIMPNHVHLIVVIGTNEYNRRDAMHCVSTKNTFGAQRKNLASIIRGIKASTTTHARRMGTPFGWQTRYHEHIVRNINELNRIAEYIENNIARWENDCYNPLITK